MIVATYRRVVTAWFVWDNAIDFLQSLRVISVGKERSKNRGEEPLIGLVDSLPDRVGDATRARGGSIRGFSKRSGHCYRRDRGDILECRKNERQRR